MSKKMEVEKVGGVTFAGLIQHAEKAAKPIPMGVQVFEARAGASFIGMYLGITTVHVNDAGPEEQEIAKDQRVKHIPNVVFAVNEYFSYRSPNKGLVQHFENTSVEAGTIVRVTCKTKGVKGETTSTWEVEILMFPKDVPDEFRPLLNAFVGHFE